MGEEPKRISRRDFLKLGGAGAVALAMSRLKIGRAEGRADATEVGAELLSRKEHFKPFNRGNAEWQYVEFQYDSNQGERNGITVSLSELTDPVTSNKTQQLLVMKHNVDRGYREKYL